LAALHLLFASIEIIYRPIFPWDAWLNWMYRAKAWFYVGSILPMDAPATCISENATAKYNVAGHNYPSFPSIIALWASTAPGRWSETLVNRPVLLCGLAMPLGLYGQCRELEIPRWLAAFSAYLLLSIPLVGNHLALAGQADGWMMEFTGLGFTALLVGLVSASRFQIALGFTMVALAIGIKNEGLPGYFSG
jgi:hypothetical protein